MAKRSIFSATLADWLTALGGAEAATPGSGGAATFASLSTVAASFASSTAASPAPLSYAVDPSPLVGASSVTVSAQHAAPARDTVGITDLPATLSIDPLVDPGMADVLAQDSAIIGHKAAAASPVGAIERLIQAAAGDLFTVEMVDIAGPSFMTPGADPFGRTSFMLIDADGDGINDLVIRLDDLGPTLMGTDFLI